MASSVTQRQLIIQNENVDIHQKNAVVDGKTKNSKKAARKGGVGFGSRKALNDITNKSSTHHEASSKKKNLPKEEFNVAEEGFLHDHKRCIEEQQAVFNKFNLELVLPGHGVSTDEYTNSKQVKVDLDSPRCCPKPEELPISEFTDWLNSSTQWESPPCSPIHWDSPLSSPFAWKFEDVEFVLKEENDT